LITSELITSPLILPSLPITIFVVTVLSDLDSEMMVPNAEANFTTSIAVKAAPGFPPIVPLIPDILLINATEKS
jgi:hypothetical protein